MYVCIYVCMYVFFWTNCVCFVLFSFAKFSYGQKSYSCDDYMFDMILFWIVCWLEDVGELSYAYGDEICESLIDVEEGLFLMS